MGVQHAREWADSQMALALRWRLTNTVRKKPAKKTG
jgi:hypothetical protein